ncbi:PRD domain-containing protein [Gottfriedia solisilvae]|uniref:PRD domain-containing protein n=1 Tax=Gottfriedia solisilvae TaxID=1516104 RepID=UPI003D2F2A32
MGEQFEELYQKSGNASICKEIMRSVDSLLNSEKIIMNQTGWLSLTSHISAMVYRSINAETLQPLDVNLFNEVSTESINLAEKICFMLPNLHEHEKYLLSIHFEAAKINNK